MNYILFLFYAVFSIVAQTIVVYFGMLKAANHIHNSLLDSVFHWPTTTFDRIPLGRIISRFGTDMDVLDSVLPNSIAQFLTYTAGVRTLKHVSGSSYSSHHL